MTVKDDRRHNFFIIDNEVLDLYGPHIGAIGVALYAALVRYAGDKTTCFPKHETIAAKIGVSRRTVVEYLSRLAGEDKDSLLKAHDLGPLIRIHRRKREDGGLMSNVYELLPLAKDAQPHAQDIHIGCAPVAHKEDTENKTEGTNVPSPADPKDLVLALYEDVLGLDGPTSWPKAMKQAKSLVAVGCTADEVRAIGKWLLADPFWANKGLDMGSIQAGRDKWRAAHRATPARPRQVATDEDPYLPQMLGYNE